MKDQEKEIGVSPNPMDLARLVIVRQIMVFL
jgi:hypothetical protein